MMYPSYSVEKIYQIHKEKCPDSMLSKRAIRTAVDEGTLPSIRVGNRRLIRIDVFDSWTRGDLQND